MKTELEVRRELKLIRTRRSMDDDADATNMVTYGVQQALVWMLGTGMAPSDLLKALDVVVADQERKAPRKAKERS